MNSIWNLLDWLLPSLRLPDDLPNAYTDPEALSTSSHHHRYATSSRNSSYSTLPLHHPRETHPTHKALYPPLQAATPHPSSAPQEAVASHRGPPEWQQRERERGKLDREQARGSREREKERLEREQKQQRETEALQKRVKSLEGEVERLNRELRVSREDGLAIKKIASQDYVSPPHSFPAAPPSDPAALRSAYDNLLSQHTHSHDTLVERTEELSSLKTFLSKTDDWSGAQLIQALRDLNTEIVHFSASLADELASPSSALSPYRADSSNHGHMQKAKELVAGLVGVGMTNWLLERERTEDAATVIQFAIQAWEVSCVGQAMDRFCYGLPREVDQFLTRMFDHMHRTEPQPTTSRWRALTYAHAQSILASSSNPQHPSTSPFQTLTDHNARGLLSILALCNFPSLPREALLARYGAHLARISEQAERLASAVKEGVMSAGFEVMWVRPVFPAEPGKEPPRGRRYDDSWMEDVYASVAVGGGQGMVMCTVEFGLMLVRKGYDGGHGLGHLTNGNGHANGHAHPGMANGHGKANGAASGLANGGGSPELQNGNGAPAPLTKTMLVKPRVLLDTVPQLV